MQSFCLMLEAEWAKTSNIIQEINKVLLSASKIFATLCGQGEVVCDNEKFAIKTDGIVTPFDELSVSDKLCLFLAIKLCDLQNKFPQCKTVLLHGSLSANMQEMTERLAKLDDYVFVAETFSTDIA